MHLVDSVIYVPMSAIPGLAVKNQPPCHNFTFALGVLFVGYIFGSHRQRKFPKFTKEDIVDWISKYKYGNINDLDYRKEIIDTFVNAVFVYDDKLFLTYNYKDGSETLTLQ